MYDKSSASYAAAFQKLFYSEGVPKILHCDNETEFKNKALDSVCEKFDVCRIYEHARHPQSQGQVERFNQTLKRRLSKAAGGDKKWIDVHAATLFEYNKLSHRATGKSPFAVFRGHAGFQETVHVADFSDTILNPSDSLTSHRLKYIEELKRNYNFNPKDLIVGSKVLLKKDFDNNTKTRKNVLDGFYEETLYVVVEMDARTVSIKSGACVPKVDISRLKKLPN
ncbi:hypothetical protein ENBRE01_2055 [Enteropsectra breve]|nr:hypothetical protein ENBRE01_2055 [Enteropsectra breve]